MDIEVKELSIDDLNQVLYMLKMCREIVHGKSVAIEALLMIPEVFINLGPNASQEYIDRTKDITKSVLGRWGVKKSKIILN